MFVTRGVHMTTLTPLKVVLIASGVVVFAGFAFSLVCLAHFLGYIEVPPLSLGRSPNAGFLQPFFSGFMLVVFVVSIVLWSSHRWMSVIGLFACFVWLALALLPVV